MFIKKIKSTIQHALLWIKTQAITYWQLVLRLFKQAKVKFVRISLHRVIISTKESKSNSGTKKEQKTKSVDQNADIKNLTDLQISGNESDIKIKVKERLVYKILKRVIAYIVIIFISFFCVLIYLDSLVSSKFEGRRWAISAKVFAKSLELYVGQPLKAVDFEAQLYRQGYVKKKTITHEGMFTSTHNHYRVFVRGFQFPDGFQLERKINIEFAEDQVFRLFDDTGEDISYARMDPQVMGGIYPATYEDRILVRIDRVPPLLIKALLATEDREFYLHYGISLRGIIRALFANVQAGGIVQGGSTLTQQLVKNFFLTNERTITRKAAEILMSLLLEFRYTKDEILEAYLNEIYLGQQGMRSVHGFELASYFYFGRPLQETSLAQQALLVALVKGPSWYNPRLYPERTKVRRDTVLDMLSDFSSVLSKDIQIAKNQPLGVVSGQRLKSNAFPAYVDLVKRQLRADYKEADLTTKGLKIFTNMDPILQQNAQESVAKMLKIMEKDIAKREKPIQQEEGARKPILQGAVVISDVKTGKISALVSGRNVGFAGFNRVLDAHRPIGSLIKPAIYLTALASPNKYTLATQISDESINVPVKEGVIWEPKNFDKLSHGEVSLLKALSKSYNQATVRLGMEIGIDGVINTLKKLGVKQKIPPYPSLLLGALNMTPLQVAAMYQTLASGGLQIPLRAIDKVIDAEGKFLKEYLVKSKEVFSPEVMALIRYAMIVTMREGTGRRAYWTLPASMVVAGKTGTSDDMRDSWFSGFSKNNQVTAWVGYDDYSPSKVTGSSGALRIWIDFISRTQQVSLNDTETEVENIEYYWIDDNNGLRARRGCEKAINLPFIYGSEPSRWSPCVGATRKTIMNWFRDISKDTDTTRTMEKSTDNEEGMLPD